MRTLDLIPNIALIGINEMTNNDIENKKKHSLSLPLQHDQLINSIVSRLYNLIYIFIIIRFYKKMVLYRKYCRDHYCFFDLIEWKYIKCSMNLGLFKSGINYMLNFLLHRILPYFLSNYLKWTWKIISENY